MKKTKKKNNKTQKKSRHIPKAVAKAVNQKHFFECAWCCTKITEKHHITEFSKGGEHIEENLILLCSNCHTEVHDKDGKISEEDLLKRKSTHLQGDRLTGNLVFELKSDFIRLGEIGVKGFKNILAFGGVPVISFEFDEDRKQFFLNCKMYDNYYLKFWLENDELKFMGKSYHKNGVFEVSSNELKIGSNNHSQSFNGEGVLVSNGGNLFNLN
jgi:hypothetical protein